ncbi:(3S,6E)-nerolidol synthase 1-like [Asparagus officinalis]|uniref:(3S,6E)-nerolidol synthase 1-like n=1 Tax=Asparagus officinalis TaxID=4686 RepID=UPI00098E015A|nr:(3S,6E)-nerolidol synthase 1-like [Asparagus officinalis]
MASTLPTCFALSFLSSKGSRGSSPRCETVMSCSSQAYYPQIIPRIQQLGLLTTSVVKKARYVDYCVRYVFVVIFQLRGDYSPVKHMENIVRLKNILVQVNGPWESMLTVDYLQKLGIDYHFKEEIKLMLECLYENMSGNEHEQVITDLFETALSFRLLRQAGHPICSDVLTKFTDKKGRFKSSLRGDVQGLLSLYEASYLNTGEEILDVANEFSSMHLACCIKDLEPNAAKMVKHTLQHPCHMTISRYNTRHYLDHCHTVSGINIGMFEEVARMDFNLLQSLHQKELIQILSWWKSTGLSKHLKFVRKQPLKWYITSMTVLHDPEFSKCRIEMTKVIAFIYIIDDIFDIHGSPDELNLFLDAISKWELSAVDILPTYMKCCYIALYDITNEIAQSVLKEQGWNPINSLKKAWTRLCNAFLLESRWLQSNQLPKSDEYLKNAIVSSGVHAVLMHAFFLLGQGITKENVSLLERNPTLLSCPATILRLRDDLGSAKDEHQDGFDGSYVECYMKEYPECSTQDARDYVKQMIANTWRCFNKECFSQNPFAPNLVTACLNIARMVEVMYSYDENGNIPSLEDYIRVLLYKSI